MLRFVYVKGMRGPVPELWHDVPTNGAGMVKTTPLQSVDLPDTFADIPLEQLSALYPYHPPQGSTAE